MVFIKSNCYYLNPISLPLFHPFSIPSQIVLVLIDYQNFLYFTQSGPFANRNLNLHHLSIFVKIESSHHSFAARAQKLVSILPQLKNPFNDNAKRAFDGYKFGPSSKVLLIICAANSPSICTKTKQFFSASTRHIGAYQSARSNTSNHSYHGP